MRMTSKGQVTIPKEVRDALGLRPGSNVGFEREGGKILVVNGDKKPNLTAGQELVRHLQDAGRKARRIEMTTDELMELTRGPFNDVDSR